MTCSASLANCPPEILKEVFTYACNDDGSTGRALSIVSRYIHKVSEDLKYRSLAIHGVRQLFNCSVLLEAKPPELRRIHHLFIASAKHCNQRQASNDPVDSLVEYRSENKIDHDHETARESLTRILRIAAPTLKTLYIYTHWNTPTFFPQVPLLHLVDFTFCSPFPGIPDSLPTAIYYPSLKRIRFTGFLTNPRDAICDFVLRAPNLVYLVLQPNTVSRRLLEQVALTFGVTGIASRRKHFPFPSLSKEDITNVKTILFEHPLEEHYNPYVATIIEQLFEHERRFTAVSVKSRDLICSNHAFQDWLQAIERS